MTPDQSVTPGAAPRRLIVAAAILLLILAVVFGAAYLQKPQSLEVSISGPRGAEVYLDLVVDGQAQSQVQTVPVTEKFLAREVRFAVIGADPSTGPITVDLAFRRGTASITGDGVRGFFEANGWLSALTYGQMSAAHVDSMRSASLKRTQDSLSPR